MKERLYRVSSILPADDAVLIADSEESLYTMVIEIGVVYGMINPRVNVNKSKVAKSSKS